MKVNFLCCRIAPAMLRQASYGTIKIGTYQSFKRLLVERPEGESQFLFLCLKQTHTQPHTQPAVYGNMCTFLLKVTDVHVCDLLKHVSSLFLI